jgi:hypothetical protein
MDVDDLATLGVIEAFFFVMGKPDMTWCQCSLVIDKWRALVVQQIAILLGQIFITRKMTVGMTKPTRAC